MVRSNDVTVVWCNTTGERWHLVCRNGRWIGGMPTNCSTGTSLNGGGGGGGGGSDADGPGASPVSAGTQNTAIDTLITVYC